MTMTTKPGPPTELAAVLLDHLNNKLQRCFLAVKTAEEKRVPPQRRPEGLTFGQRISQMLNRTRESPTAERISIVDDRFQAPGETIINIWVIGTTVEITGKVLAIYNLVPTSFDLNDPASIDQINAFLRPFYEPEHGA